MYDFSDTEMMEALRPSIEEAQPITTQVRGPPLRRRSQSPPRCVVHLSVCMLWFSLLT